MDSRVDLRTVVLAGAVLPFAASAHHSRAAFDTKRR
jgi:hypothetical protein